MPLHTEGVANGAQAMANLTGTPQNDRINGGILDDVIHGGAGNDVIMGDSGDFEEYPIDFSGQDVLYGDDGDDTLIGDGISVHRGDHGQFEDIGGSDRIYGGAGNDRIIGGQGGDILYGGAGADTFVFEYNPGVPEYPGPVNYDSGVGPNARDVIRDFQVGTDKLEIHTYSGGGYTVVQYKPDWILIKIDANGDHRTDGQILVHTGLAQINQLDLFV